VGDTKPPNITLCEIDGKMFNQNSITLNFTINEPTSWIGYSLDNSTQIPITANTTLTLTAGNHTLTVYANDTYGNSGQSEMTHFTVLINPIESPTDDLALLASAILVIAAVVAAFVIIKRKQKPSETINRYMLTFFCSSTGTVCSLSRTKTHIYTLYLQGTK
jgi:hypothetical protein